MITCVITLLSRLVSEHRRCNAHDLCRSLVRSLLIRQQTLLHFLALLASAFGLLAVGLLAGTVVHVFANSTACHHRLRINLNTRLILFFHIATTDILQLGSHSNPAGELNSPMFGHLPELNVNW